MPRVLTCALPCSLPSIGTGAVILATEPLWAALFAALWLSEDFGANDYIGGSLIVLACLANTLKPSDFNRFLGDNQEDKPSEVSGKAP